MSNYSLFFIIILYLFLLFYIAFIAEKKGKSKWVNNSYIYSLSLAVYCSAWTYYGSVGIAANSGITFLTIYLGPVIAAPLWILLLRKIIRISKQQKISTLADFISLRYGNSRFLGALVTLICLIGTLPYISLQLKAVSDTFEIVTDDTSYVSTNIFEDSTFYIAVLLAIFAALFGTLNTDASNKHRGIIATVAFESVLKLVFFLIIGGYVTFYLFDGTQDIYNQISERVNFKGLVSITSLEAGFNWFFMMMLSFFAIFLLPRQFQVTVLENNREKHLKKAIWLFPLYLLIFNFFVIFIAWGGSLSFDKEINAEYFALLLPLKNGHILLTLLVFLGGLSAVISMVVISTLALSTMVSNNLVIPYGFLDKFIRNRPERNSTYIKSIRRVAIFLIIILAYGFYYNFSVELSLFSIGLISFVIIAQLAPSFFIGLFWNRGSAKAAIFGIIVGFLITSYTLILPFILEAFTNSKNFTNNGLFGLEFLKPNALFGIDFFTPPVHAFFWSISLNTICYLIVSLIYKGNYRERNYAEMFVDSENYTKLQDGVLVWKGEAYVADIRNILVKFLGEKRTARALSIFFTKYKLPKDTQLADARLINFSEKLLTGSIGSSSAKILIASVIKEEEISLVEVLKILEESKEANTINKLLTEKSNELSSLASQLKEANENLIAQDHQKNEFLDTVAHELKTPITGIRAATELIIDDKKMPVKMRTQFLQNILQDSDRLSRLIFNILDFEKLSSERDYLQLEYLNIKDTILKALNSISQIANKKNVQLFFDDKEDFYLTYDEDRILQVLTNLLSNAIKFCMPIEGKVDINCRLIAGFLEVSVTDNGKKIPEEDLEFIFDKFYQSKNQNTIKPQGSGLGLAISKKIIERHKGKIWAINNKKNGVTLVFKIPY
ncbi:sensor histidine kinase [Polaribacter tangerinus]|uniref:sensor histidine kinase n=1 Tax=Polaribacter tangerinus TaxID=1920034 RepID=UPI000B4AB9BC|nr:sensor histidine kinase [Polaribacter tangerinus]